MYASSYGAIFRLFSLPHKAKSISGIDLGIFSALQQHQRTNCEAAVLIEKRMYDAYDHMLNVLVNIIHFTLSLYPETMIIRM